MNGFLPIYSTVPECSLKMMMYKSDECRSTKQTHTLETLMYVLVLKLNKL